MFKIVIAEAPKFPDFNKMISRNVMIKIALQIQTDIVARTKAGKDFDLNSFIPYASSNKKKFGQVVDLTGTGQMLNSVKPKANDNTALIYITNEVAKKKAGWNEYHAEFERGFFGLSAKNILTIRNYFRNLLKRILNNDN